MRAAWGAPRMWAPLWRACCRAAGASARLGGGEARARLTRGSGGKRAPAGERGAGRPWGPCAAPCPARRFCLPRSWGLQEAPVVLVLRGLQVSGQPPRGTASVSLSSSPGAGGQPQEIATATERAIPSPKCMGRLAVQVVRSSPRA